jgi:ABC-type transporter Mla subunit MlaD
MRIPGVPGPRDVLTVAERTGELVEWLIGALPRVMRLLDAAERIVADVEGLVSRMEETRAGADALVASAAAAEARLVELMDRLEPSLTALQPTLDRLAETTDPREIDALVSIVDRLPALAEQIERDVVPVMRTLSTVSPDLHDLLDTSRELNEMLARLPGMGRIKRRVDAQQAAGQLPR